jgi:glutamyl-tRNA synthetase
MRIEDLDPDRSRADYARAALDDLDWLGIRWQEGPSINNPNRSGPYAPYAQSHRQSVYLAAWRALLDGDHIYPCRCSRKDLEAALSAPHEGSRTADPLDDEPVYPGTCRSSQAAIQTDSPNGVNWRFRVPDGEAIEFEDGNLGHQCFIAGRDFGDFVVWRRDGVPSYQLACVADDSAMRITEVVRGEDLLKSTARQILLNRALGYRNPDWFHCCLVVDAYGHRLAKRYDALSIRILRQRGISPEQILKDDLPAGE